MARYGMARVRAVPDTLVRLSDEHTRPWAALEERVLKGANRLLAQAQAQTVTSNETLSLAPWLDLYYRQGDK
jgi:hypothetical protein